ncbi:MAG TPA: hypothetical protein DEB06_08070 [Phycisphaerales bacterium]|nr:hypothetical protein [Phycisphaerales bacterium]
MTQHPHTSPPGIPRDALEQVNDPEWEIAPWTTQRLLRDEPGKWALIDCRRAEELALARVDGAPMFTLADMPAQFPEIQKFAGERRVVVMCHSGRRSLKAAMLLREAGFDGALSMCGGIQRWSEEVDPRVPQY